MLIRLMNCAASEPKSYKTRLQILKDNTALLQFTQVFDYKQMSIFTCALEVEDEERIKQHIKFRHRFARVLYDEMEARLAQVCKLIEERNPSLIKQLCK